MSDLTAVSLFGGIEGFGLAMHRAGIQVKAAVEIDPDCRGVIARHFPDVALFGDVRTVTGDDLRAAGFVPGRGIVTAGFPCQDLSVAGRRSGLGEGTRSGLYWEIDRLLAELRPAWVILENVPGLLSAVCPDPGAPEFTSVDGLPLTPEYEWPDDWELRLDAPPEPPKPRGACEGGCFPAHGGAMGLVLGSLAERGYGFAYRVLDSQFFGVPQRRARVFIVGHLGDGAAPVQVLLEPEGGKGDIAPGSEARPDVAGTLGSRAGGSRTTDLDGHGAYIPAVGTLGTSGPGGGWRVGADEAAAGQLVIPVQDGRDMEKAQNGLGIAADGEPAYTVDTTGAQAVATLQGGGRRGHRIDAEGAAGGHLVIGQNGSDIQVGTQLGALTAGMARQTSGDLIADAPLPSRDVIACDTSREGKGADSDATSGFVFTAPVALRGRGEGSRIEYGQNGDPAFTVRTPGGGSSYPMVAHALTSEGADASEDGTGRGTVTSGVPRPVPSSLASTLTSGRSASDGVNHPGRRQEDDVNLVPMAFNPQTGGTKARIGYSEKPGALHSSQVPGVHTAATREIAQALTANYGKQPDNSDTSLGPTLAHAAAAVRRLTPRECERLQAFPDDWTRWRLEDGREVEQSDSARYRQVGNAVTVAVPEWILRRLVAVDAALRESEAVA